MEFCPKCKSMMTPAKNIYKCRKCGKLHYPFHDRCLECKGREFDQIKPQGNAKLLTYTAIFNLPWGFDQRYLIIGVAEFENKIASNAFASIKPFTKFLDYDSVAELHTKVSESVIAEQAL